MEAADIIPPRLPGFNWEYPLYMARPDEEIENAWSLMFRIIDLMNSDVSGRGARLTVSLITSVVQGYPALWEKFRASLPVQHREDLDPDATNDRIGDWCR